MADNKDELVQRAKLAEQVFFKIILFSFLLTAYVLQFSQFLLTLGGTL